MNAKNKPEREVLVRVSARELAHVLAGLRLLQSTRQTSSDLNDIATDGGTHEPMAPGEIDELCEKLNVSRLGEGQPTLPKDVAERLHRWGDKDSLYTDVEDAFLNAYDQDGFVFGEQFFYDPETRKAYQTWLQLKIEETEPPDDDTCPECGEGLTDALDVPGDQVCDVCRYRKRGG
jgi:hypothetical protein